MSKSTPQARCPQCGRVAAESGCQLLICHTCEAQRKGRHRTIECDGRPQVSFRKNHAKCAQEGWGTNL